MIELEICSNGIRSTQQAALGGANRVELCDNLGEGGTTPSIGTVEICTKIPKIEIWPILRPRGGDFLYSSEEKESMLRDVFYLKNLPIQGIVTGALLSNGELDIAFLKDLMKKVEQLPWAFHRAIDMTKNPMETVETLASLGFKRVLSSGGSNKAMDGIDLLKDLQNTFGHRIQIMPGSGIDEGNVVKILKETGCRHIHVSLRTSEKSEMTFQKEGVFMGKPDFGGEYSYQRTDSERVKNILSLTKNI
jgi:copper homeostasis protein